LRFDVIIAGERAFPWMPDQRYACAFLRGQTCRPRPLAHASIPLLRPGRWLQNHQRSGNCQSWLQAGICASQNL